MEIRQDNRFTRPRLPGWLLKGGLLFGSLVLGLVFAELFVRLLVPQPLAGIMYSTDRRVGFWNQPNLREKPFQSEPNCPPYTVTTSPEGYRQDRPVMVPKPESLRRVLALGDSFTFGVGVANRETWPAQLEDRLQVPDHSPIEVVNEGCAGWGT
ncbi:hypothetical protein HQ520_11445, partial [bacterium]|nr:hypothetical protein [bacterium]